MASKVLSALDSSRTQLYHFRAIIIADMGIFYDAYSYGVLFPDAYGPFPEAYDLFCIPLILILNGRVYYEKEAELNKHVIPPVRGCVYHDCHRFCGYCDWSTGIGLAR